MRSWLLATKSISTFFWGSAQPLLDDNGKIFTEGPPRRFLFNFWWRYPYRSAHFRRVPLQKIPYKTRGPSVEGMDGSNGCWIVDSSHQRSTAAQSCAGLLSSPQGGDFHSLVSGLFALPTTTQHTGAGGGSLFLNYSIDNQKIERGTRALGPVLYTTTSSKRRGEGKRDQSILFCFVFFFRVLLVEVISFFVCPAVIIVSVARYTNILESWTTTTTWPCLTLRDTTTVRHSVPINDRGFKLLGTRVDEALYDIVNKPALLPAAGGKEREREKRNF